MTLVTLSEPTGFWASILSAFKNGLGSYILAVILLAIIVRLIFSLVDIVNKKVTMRNADINAKMKPELEALQKKYGYDQKVLQQKTNELYKKYQFNVMSSCLPMIIMLALQLTVFLTLWSALQNVANYNIVSQYETMKNIYANVININTVDDGIVLSNIDEVVKNFVGEDEEYSLSIEITTDDNGEKVMEIYVVKSNGDSSKAGTVSYIENLSESNETVYNLIGTYVVDLTVEDEESSEDEEATESQDETEESVTEKEPVVYSPTRYSELLKLAAEEAVEKYYLETQEGFLWIKNVYKSDSPSSPLFTESEIKSYLSKYYSESELEEEELYDYEGTIFNCVVAGIDTEELGSNGYYILTIITVIVSFLSLWLSNKLMRGKNKAANQKSSWAMYVIMPVIYAIFTFMYTSLFAIYLIIGQIIMLLITPFTTWIVKKWNEHDLKKQQDKNTVEVDYRRKDV